MIHTGVNASGRAVVSPIDGIGVIGIQLVTAQYTTCATVELRWQWLCDDGDVAKAERILEEERRGDQPPLWSSFCRRIGSSGSWLSHGLLAPATNDPSP